MPEKSHLPADTEGPVLLWFRTDLRLQDHPGINMALGMKRPILPVYVLDDGQGTRPHGSASRWWLHRSLQILDEELRKLGSRLILRRGETKHELLDIIKKYDIKTVIWSPAFDPRSEQGDTELQARLELAGVAVHQHNATLLAPPNMVRTGDGAPYRVFPPFFRAMQAAGFCDSQSMPPPPGASFATPSEWPVSLELGDLGLDATTTPSGVNWAGGFARFTPGERGARKALRRFIAGPLAEYAEGRDRADRDVTSHLSPHLRFGEISPQRVLHEVDKAAAEDSRLIAGAAKLRAELVWREFSYGLLAQQPDLHRVNFRSGFDRFPWRDGDSDFRAWCRGETGYGLVDAGMHELWRTGYMHNRVRMVCASFLTKHLLVDWRRGEQWFWDCLLDADPASNPANWQWVAGCGADAAPYFRIFNPITQAEKFDPDGAYRRRHIDGYQPRMRGRGTDLFDDGPAQIVDHAFARQRALDAYQNKDEP